MANTKANTITKHIQNIYEDEQLKEKEVCPFFEHTSEDGKTIQCSIL